MLEATVHRGSEQLGFQQEVPEARSVDGSIVGLLAILLIIFLFLFRLGLILLLVEVRQLVLDDLLLRHLRKKQ